MALTSLHGKKRALFGISQPRDFVEESSPTIHVAAAKGDVEELKAFLAGDPSLLESTDSEGATPLHWAVAKEHLEASQFLVASGASVDAKDHQGESVLRTAARHGLSQIAALLIAGGATVQEQLPGGETLLHYAARSGKGEVIEVLLKNGVRIDAVDQKGWTALHTAANDATLLEPLKVLIARRANLEVQDHNGLTPLLLAGTRGHREMARILLASGAKRHEMPQGFAVPVTRTNRSAEFARDWRPAIWVGGIGNRAMAWLSGRVIGFFADELTENASVPELLPSRTVHALLAIAFAVAVPFAWFLIPVLGLPLTLAAYLAGRMARKSTARWIGVSAMIAALVEALPSLIFFVAAILEFSEPRGTLTQ
jgi:ankyrin repeat protein